MQDILTEDYRNALNGSGPLANQWKDKPHRLVYDLCNEIERLRFLLLKELTEATFTSSREEEQ